MDEHDKQVYYLAGKQKQNESVEKELGDDLPYTTGQIWAACGVLVVVLLAMVFGGAWMGVQL